MNDEFAALFKLARAERLQLIEDLWDSIAQDGEELPVPEWKRDELRRRKEHFLADPASGRTWEQVQSACSELRMTTPLKIVVERHADGYVAYPLGLARGAVVGQGDTYDEALADVRSAIEFHVETFGPAALAPAEEDPILEAFVAESALPA